MSLATSASGRAVTQLRGLPFIALSGSGYVVTTSGTTDSGGGLTSAITTGSTVVCRIDPLGGGEGEVAERISDRSSHLITLPPDTSISTADDFHSLDESEDYEITAVRDRTGTGWMLTCEAVKRD